MASHAIYPGREFICKDLMPASIGQLTAAKSTNGISLFHVH